MAEPDQGEAAATAAAGFDVLLPADRAGSPIATGDLEALAAHYEPPAASAGRQWVRASMVATVDGAAVGADGLSGSVSSPADRVVFALLRGLADAVLVGAGTARAENYGPAGEHPLLADRRAAQGRRRAPVVVQVTRSGQVHTGRGLTEPAHGGLVVLPAGDEAALSRARAAVGSDRVLLAGHVDQGGVDLGAALDLLARRGFSQVLAEGGPSLLGAVLAAGRLNELCLTTSPRLVGGDGSRITSGPAALGGAWRPAGLLHADGTLLSRWLRAPS